MLTGVEELEAHQLQARGWSISAIARHVGHDRKTVRAYLSGERSAGTRASAAPDPGAPFVEYVTRRLGDDPHVWATVLFDEVVALGYARSYQSFTRMLRARGLAQTGLDRFCARIADKRRRPPGRLPDEIAARFGSRRPNVTELAVLEHLAALPAVPFPATVTSTVTVSASALARFDGNAYAVPVGLIGTLVEVRHRLGTPTVEVVTPAGVTVASHRLAPTGLGEIVRDPAQRAELEGVVLGAFTTARPCQTKLNRPPSPEAKAIGERLLAGHHHPDVVVDLAAYQAVVDAAAVPAGTRAAR